jgi:hypothetical protein
MIDLPTPETDAVAEKNIYGVACKVDVDFARKLERERDEAREKIDNIRNTLSKNGEAVGNGDYSYSVIEMVENLLKSKDFFLRKSNSLQSERDDALSQIVQAECRAERFCQERDEARNDIVGWENKWKCAVDMAARASLERDAALNKLKELKDILR